MVPIECWTNTWPIILIDHIKASANSKQCGQKETLLTQDLHGLQDGGEYTKQVATNSTELYPFIRSLY